ncbi:MAG: SWIM zinc finger family protein [Planctomycetota bacterium]
MSAAAALDYTYRYAFASNVDTDAGPPQLRLATFDAKHRNPHFFEGRLLFPHAVGAMLLTLADVVRTHFFLPRPALLDPVVTTHEDIVRFEGFSGCCGVYARVDLPADAFDADLVGRGTTNVDFNQPMRAALAGLRDRDTTRLAVGQNEVQLQHNDQHVVEKKVKLPVRWLKGFSEVQAYQPGLQPKLQTTGHEARRFIRSLPRSNAPKRPVYATPRGRGLGLTQRPSRTTTKDTVAFHGTHRLRVLEPLLQHTHQLTAYADDHGTSAWQIDAGPNGSAGRFFLMLSPETYRGFSGEGQTLQALATGDYQDALPAVRAQLAWQPHLDPDALAVKANCTPTQARHALAALGSRGLAGYDVTTGTYFHREMPFDLDAVETLQPRLRAARKLLADGGVEYLGSPQPDHHDYAVAGTGVTHRVRLRPNGDKCTCPWFSKHQGQRGPCKHILAAQLHLNPDDP